MVFTYQSDRVKDTQPIEKLIGTSAEEFVLGEIVTLSSGVLTKAGLTSAGTQKFIVMADATGDGTLANVPVMKLRKDAQFRATADATVAATLVGQAVTLNAAATNPTATTTAGVFEIDYTDGATDVIGHFVGTGVL